MLDKTEITLLLMLIKERMAKTEDSSFEFLTLVDLEQTLNIMLGELDK